MKSITLAVSKGGVGKSLLTANIGASLAAKGKRVILIEGDPNHPLQVILGVDLPTKDPKLDDVVKEDMNIERAVYSTKYDNLFLVPSGVSLREYFEINPASFTKKILDLKTDFMFVDVPFPLGEAAFLSLGICEYFIILLTEDEFVLCVEAAIDTIRLGKYFLKCIPLGFMLNRIKTTSKFTKEFIRDLENLLEIPCIAQIKEDPEISKSYGGVGSRKAFLAYQEFRDAKFSKSIDGIASMLLGKLPKPEKKNIEQLIMELNRPSYS